MIKQRTRRRQQTTRQCKPNNVGNEHDTNGLLQKNVYRNKKNQKFKQQTGSEQVENKKTTTNNITTQTQTNNAGNEHDRNNKLSSL